MDQSSLLERLFLDHLEWIDGAAAALARRHGLELDEAEDFASWAKMKMMEGDYAVLRKFRGESSIRSYLAVVLAMYAREYRVHRWGRWRPSAAASRRGSLAIRLETLLRRDGYQLREAAEVLRSKGEAGLSDRELAKLASELPADNRGRPRDVELSAVPDPSSPAAADDVVTEMEAEVERKRVQDELSRLLSAFAPEDNLILRMRFWEDLSVADIGRGLGLQQKPLYRRIDRLLNDLRRALERAGITREQARELIDPGAR